MTTKVLCTTNSLEGELFKWAENYLSYGKKFEVVSCKGSTIVVSSPTSTEPPSYLKTALKVASYFLIFPIIAALLIKGIYRCTHDIKVVPLSPSKKSEKISQTPQSQTPQSQTPQSQTPQSQTPQSQTPQSQTPQAVQRPPPEPSEKLSYVENLELADLKQGLYLPLNERHAKRLSELSKKISNPEDTIRETFKSSCPFPSDHDVSLAANYFKGKSLLAAYQGIRQACIGKIGFFFNPSSSFSSPDWRYPEKFPIQIPLSIQTLFQNASLDDIQNLFSEKENVSVNKLECYLKFISNVYLKDKKMSAYKGLKISFKEFPDALSKISRLEADEFKSNL